MLEKTAPWMFRIGLGLGSAFWVGGAAIAQPPDASQYASARAQALQVEADVSESSIAQISVGQPAEVQLDAFPALRLAGHVNRIVPDVDRSKATLLVKVQFDETDPRLLPDMSAKVAFLSRRLESSERTPVAAVRPEAIVTRGGKKYVFVVSTPASDAAGHAVMTEVQVGSRIGELVRIQGVAPGARIVIGAPNDLADGALVAAQKA